MRGPEDKKGDKQPDEPLRSTRGGTESERHRFCGTKRGRGIVEETGEEEKWKGQCRREALEARRGGEGSEEGEREREKGQGEAGSGEGRERVNG